MKERVSLWCVGLVTLLAGASLAYSQATTSQLNGNVLDAEKHAVPGDAVSVLNVGTGAVINTTADDKGYWAVPGLQAGVYQVTITHTGFSPEVVKNVKIDAGVPATVNASLKVGSASQTVEVTAGAEVVQSTTATVANTIESSQIQELPFTSRNVTELVATQPGSEAAGGIRYSLIDNLPQSTIHQTLDGVNILDNGAGGGIFVAIQPRMDAVQEVTVSTASSGADSLGEGAVQMKFVTKSGTNQWHGDIFEQNRNQVFEANYFFNAAAGLPHDSLNLNDYGGSVGGPIIKNKVFIFFTVDAFRLPQSILENGQEWLTPTAATGVFTYKEATGANAGTVNTVNLYGVAQAQDTKGLPNGVRQFPTQADPGLNAMETEIQTLVTASGLPQVSRIASNNDYNRYNFSWLPTAQNNRNFPESRLDWDINSKNRFSYIVNWQTNNRLPDAVNNTEAILPGTGGLVGSPILAGQIDDFWSMVGSERMTVSNTMTNEVRFSEVGGADWFDGPIAGATAPLNQYWYGTVVTPSYITNPYRITPDSPSKRDDPVTQFNDTLSWVKGNHLAAFGFDFSSVSEYSWSQGSQLYPQATLSNISTDPDNSGAANLFTVANFPGASATNLSDAAALYALLTGRVSAISTQAALDPTTGKYGNGTTQSFLRQREYAIYGQDAWKVNSRLSLNYGLRYEKQQPFEDINGVFTNPGYAGMFGISGVGNLFMPGTLTGTAPAFQGETQGTTSYPNSYRLDPSVGFAYELPQVGGLERILGAGAVVRGGYAISNIREATSDALSSNPGRTISTAVSAANTPAVFSAGQVQLADFGGGTGHAVPTLAPTSIDPTFPTPSYPIPVQTTNSLNDYAPNLKMEYVQSWDFGLQRQIGTNTALEIRYVGNHGTDLWRSINLNEVNIFGAATGGSFLTQFQEAQNNLAIARNPAIGNMPTTNNFGNQGFAGQVNVPILTDALTGSSTTTNQLLFGSAGAMASGIATNSTEMAKLVTAGYPANLFVVNPATNSSVNLTTNAGDSTYNSLQIELRRRMSHGLLVSGSYVYSKGLTNTGNGIMTLRDTDLDKGPSPEDLRNSFKLNWLWDLPVGPGHEFLGHSNSGLSRLFLSGWSYNGVARMQSGPPSELMSGTSFASFNQGDPGVVLNGITAKQLQSEMHPYIVGEDPAAIVYYLPQALITNSLAAYGVSGTLNAGQPYIGPPAAGQLGDRVYLYGPWLNLFDMSLVKHTQLYENLNLELRIQADNVFNAINFGLPGSGTSAGQQSITPSSTSLGFGQTTTSFRDFSNTSDPGSRTLDLYIILRF